MIHFRHLTFGLLALLLLGSAAHAQTTQWSSPSAPPPPPQAGTARVLAAGEAIRVQWSGGWYNARVLQVGEGRYRVRYDGWSADWDEWVTPDRMRRSDGGAVAAPPSAPRPPVTAAAPAPAPAAAPAARPSATPRAAPPPAPAASPAPPRAPAAPVSKSPTGRWECATWDAGQLNRIGGFTLNQDGSYRDQNSGGTGRYTFTASTGRIAFTSGPQKINVPVTFQPAARDGAGMIVFDYGGGARLDCYRAR